MGIIEKRQRNRATRTRRSFVVIGCEGKNKTETIYLKNYSSRECIIKFSTGNSTDPVGMAKDLVTYISNEDIKSEYGDKMYLILDTDVNQNKQIQIDEAKRICEENGIELITSTPCVEIWYLLHYGYKTKMYQSSEQAKIEMKKFISDYSESKDVFPIIYDKTGDAIKNSKMLEKYQVENGQAVDNENCNSYTGVYKVVEELISRNN